MRPSSIQVAVALLALCSVSFAQELGGPGAARARAKTLAESFKGYDEQLGGTTHFGVYLHGAKNIGQATLTVSRADGDSLHAVYQTSLAVDIAFGETKAAQRETLLLGAHLGALSVTQTETLHEGPVVEQEHTRVERGEEEWICTRREGAKKRTTRYPAKAFNHQGLASRLLLSRKLDLNQPGTYRFNEIDWPALPEDGEEPETPLARDVIYVVPALADYAHRGKTVRAYVLRIERDEEATANVVLSAKGELLAFWADGSPLRMIVGSEEESAADLVKGEPIVPGTQSPLAACAQYVHVAAHLAEVEALDSVVDWAAVHKDMSDRNPKWKQFDVEAFSERIKRSLKDAPGLTKNQVEQFLMILEARVEGDEATVSAATLARPFKLKKFGDHWKLTRLAE